MGYEKLALITLREREVLRHIAVGRTSKEIADLLVLSKHTVDTHRRNMLKKSGLRNTAELVIKSMEDGIIE